VGEGISGIPKRVEAWLTEHSRPREQLSTFMVHSGAVEMLSTKAVGDFVRNVTNRLGERKPAMVVIDTLARCFAGGDENTAKDMGQLVASCDLFRSSWPGCSVLVLHHSGKDESKKARGSTVLLGAADCEMELKKQKGGLLQLRCTKMKDSDGFSAKTMQLKRRNGSCVLTPIRGKSIGDRAKKEIKGTGAILSALRKGPLARKKLLGRVRSKLGAYSDTTLGSALKPLITKRLVIKTDGGLYQLRAAAVPRSGPDTNHTGL
jgi:hypothetical protein